MMSAVNLLAQAVRSWHTQEMWRRELNWLGCCTDEDYYNGSTFARAKRGPKAPPFSGEKGVVVLAPKDDPEFFARQFCNRMRDDANDSRRFRGREDLIQPTFTKAWFAVWQPLPWNPLKSYN